MPSIFLSHSAKTPFAERVRNGVAARLEEQGFTVLLDRTCLDPGDAWRPKLHRYLGSCHGAVLLFSEEALQSDWVLKEATILTWRHSLNRQLRIVPALLGAVTPDKTQIDRFRALELGEIQFARIAATAETDENADALIEEIVRPFRDFAYGETDPAMRDWLRSVRDCLRRASPEALEEAAGEMKMAPRSWDNADDLVSTLAYHLLCSDFRGSLEALRILASSVPKEFFSRLVDLVVPTWVSQEAARLILPVTRLDPAHRNLAINAEYPDTGECYLWRATCCRLGVPPIRATDVSGEAAEEETLVRFDRACRRAFGLGEDKPLKWLRHAFDTATEPVFLMVGEGAMDREVLAALRQRYGSPTFVLLSGPSFPDREALGLPELETIEPALGPDEEMDAGVQMARVRALAK